MQEAIRQLDDINFYKKLTINSVLEHNIKINKVIDDFKKQNLIIEKRPNSLKLENPKTPKFYTSPEITKQGNLGDLLLTQSILTRVIYLSFQTIIYNHMYKTHHRTLKTLNTLFKKVRNIPEDAQDKILVSVNFKSLQANILKHEDTGAVKEILNTQIDKPVATNIIIKFLLLMLTLNSFILNSIN